MLGVVLFGILNISAVAPPTCTTPLLHLLQVSRDRLEALRIRRLKTADGSFERIIASERVFLRSEGKERKQILSELLQEYQTFADQNPILNRPRDQEESSEVRIRELTLKWLFGFNPTKLNAEGKRTLHFLTPEEIVWIYSSSENREVFETAIQTKESLDRLSDFNFRLYRTWDMRGFEMHASGAGRSFSKTWAWIPKTWAWVRDISHPLVKILLPWPFGTYVLSRNPPKRLARFMSPTAKYFLDAYKNPTRELSREDEALLARYPGALCALRTIEN